MDSELKNLIEGLTEKTGISIAVAPVSAGDKTASLEPGSIKTDSKRTKTYFRFNFRTEEYICSIDGGDKVAHNYALLISRYIENYGLSEISLGFNEYLKRILSGECSKLQVQKFHVKFNVPDIACYSIVICTEGYAKNDVANVLESYSTSPLDTPILMEDGNFVYVKFMDGPADSEYQSVGEFAEYLHQSLYEELGLHVSIGVGAVAKHLYDLNASYQQAITALKTSELLSSKGYVHSYRDYALVKMLEDIPRARLQEYLTVLTGDDGNDIFEDADMVNTAEEFLENSLNVSETSRELFMHRNTLIYRLDKIEKATGLNIKSFSDAVTFRLITILKKVLGN